MEKNTSTQETDPHCIVKEYPGITGHNINDWHWTEWNAMEWVKKRADELFKDTLLYKSKSLYITSESVQWLKGDAAVTNRKKKIGAFYELELGVNFKGINKLNKTVHYGILEIPCISDDNGPSIFEVNVIRGGSVKEMWVKKKRRWKKLGLIIKQLIDELQKGACFKKRAEDSITELEKNLEKENVPEFVSNVKRIGKGPEPAPDAFQKKIMGDRVKKLLQNE